MLIFEDIDKYNEKNNVVYSDQMQLQKYLSSNLDKETKKMSGNCLKMAMIKPRIVNIKKIDNESQKKD
jgi:hypothetical protein